MKEWYVAISVGDRFPAVNVITADGPVALPDRWSRGPLVVAFHRMWCPFCQQAALQLTDAAPELHRLGGGVVIVYRADALAVARTCQERHTDALCVSDADQSLAPSTSRSRAAR
jgi:peroxiredoxin